MLRMFKKYFDFIGLETLTGNSVDISEWLELECYDKC